MFRFVHTGIDGRKLRGRQLYIWT